MRLRPKGERGSSTQLKGVSERKRVRLRKCKVCGIYTLKEECPSCGKETSSPHPPRFSPLDPYRKYRRKLKKEVEGGGNGSQVPEGAQT
ncbi:MAG: RNA-protein complex protein Nop10 [Hadesarchaea archaeon]|nr:MAG: RNA-protein complex protein Nop10 [Hadesarchaea archaeon]